MASLKCKEMLCLAYSGLLFVSGIMLIAFASVLLYRVFYHFDYIPNSTIGPLILLILLGFAHILMTWLGVKGPPREHNFHIVMFIVFTFVLLILEFAIGVWSMILWDEVSVLSTDLMTEAFNTLLRDQVYNKDWAKLQTQLQCCGLHGPKDYTAFTSEASTLPFISCKNNELSNATEIIPHEDGCQKRLIKYAEGILIESAVIGFLSAVFQGLGAFVFYTFFQTLRGERANRIARRTEIQRQMSAQSQQSQTLLPHASATTPPLAASPPPAPQP
ncbi:leukocyte surface antigen CD53 [Leptinotarsa decemlineata]|uniref:leukocyte surface antigen CD53 n=1 Tax=Leptinotarsa decemlineata TaxID=7539 RepID=UPI000C2534E1|nr:leukocyte surface antigen CD53-like [Leptinotarsa decemlineata]